MDEIRVIIDKRTELLGVLLLLSKYKEKFPQLVETYGIVEYHNDIFEKFSKFKNHKCIELLNRVIDELPFGYDGPVELFLQLNQDFTYNNPNRLMLQGELVKDLKNSNVILEFLDECINFTKESDFEKWYLKNECFYQKNINKVQSYVNDKGIEEFLMRFYKNSFKSKNKIVNLLPWTSNGNFGVKLPERSEAICNIGKLDPYEIKDEINFIDNGLRYLIVHEFGHSVVNELYEKYHSKLLDENGYTKHLKCLKTYGYGSRKIVTIEHIIRASECLYADKNGDNTEKILAYHEKVGMKYIQDCFLCLKQYYENVDKYKSFEAFFPQVVSAIETAYLKDFKTIKKEY